jgi:large repetitive protein
MNRIFTLLFLLFTALPAFSQKLDYDNDSRWFWTANVGSTWTTADVKKQHDLGLGLTIGKSFSYNYGRPLSFDIRGRYLTGNWYGQDYDSTNFDLPNTALSSGNTDYDSVMGFGVLNHLTKLHEASLELVIHANSLREKTGFDLFIFGGIGYTWYNTRGNLLGSNDSIYRYDQLSSLDKSSVKGLLDGSYESALDGSTKGEFNGAWMPSLGFGVGYQLGPRFSVGLEHKTTFTLLDNFDGYNNPNSKYKDIYHYTSAYLRFHIRDHAKTRTPDEPDNSLENVNNYDNTTTNVNVPPVVDFRNPSVSGTTVNTPNYVIRADIRNVAGSQNVIFRQNGAYNQMFTYNPSTQVFESSVVLQPGQNVFELTGTNNYGSDQEQTIIIYNRELQNPPVVNFVNPASSPTTVSNPVYALSATVLNVTQQSQCAVIVNGTATQVFTFNPSGNTVSLNVNLQMGTNIVTVTGTNAYGTDSESTTIIYRQPQTEQPPVVYFVDPNINPYTTSSNTFTINADVLNVQGSQNITFKQNGTLNQNFTYNASTDDFQSSVVLNPGQNVFEIIATNTAGTAQATTIIIYERQAPKPPVVTITNPSVNPQETPNAYYTMGATVLNVTQASQITVKLNGQNIPNFTYNNATNGVTANLDLITGSNVVIVTGTNADGTDSKQTVIIYRPVQTVLPPAVVFTNPNVDPYTTGEMFMNVAVSVTNVSAQSGVNVNVNGANQTVFTFNPATGATSFGVNLVEGANVITVTGTNTAGTASETQTIIYRKPVSVQPPIVTFTDPIVNPATVFNPVYDLKARVQHIAGAQQITLRINGQLSTGFTYSASSEMMTFTSGLVPGANIFEITATNSAGSDQKSTTIIYKLPDPQVPPVVTITNPVQNPYTVSVPATPIAATVLNVDGSQNIQVLVNGIPFTAFNYNATTKQLNFVMSLTPGSNTVEVKGTNAAGTASDNKVILFRREVLPTPPVVTFTNPVAPGSVVSAPGYTVTATVTQVDAASQIVVYQNGQTVVPALWNFNPGTHVVTMNTSLNPGNNIFTVTGTNAAGSNTATTNITYTIPVVVCDKPVLSFTAPAMSGTSVESQDYTVSVSVQNVTSANQVKLLVNGVLQSAGMLNGTIYSRQVQLVAGQNSLEVVARNNCGETRTVTTIIYKPQAAPCFPSSIQRLAPVEATAVETATIAVSASVQNVQNASQIQLVVNGQPQQFSYDAGTHIVSANVNLALGNNIITLKARNGCETAGSELSWNIRRNECTKPGITLTSSTVPNEGTTTGGTIGLVVAVGGIQTNQHVKVTHNGLDVGFVFTPQTGVLTLNTTLAMGLNTFVITAKNNCGQGVLRLAFTRKEEPVKPPVITITNPSAEVTNTDEGGMTISATTMNVTQSNQVSVTINGVPANFTFNAANGTLSFNTVFQEGQNVIVATAVTAGGTATDSKTVSYKKRVEVLPPAIVLTNPARCPVSFNEGTQTITGSVTNISSAAQVTISFNGAVIPFSSTVSNNILNFSFEVSLNQSMVSVPLVVTAANEGGSDTKSCVIQVIAPADPGIDPGRNTGTDGSGNTNVNPGRNTGTRPTAPAPAPGNIPTRPGTAKPRP